jgi:hypothetical protein
MSRLHPVALSPAFIAGSIPLRGRSEVAVDALFFAGIVLPLISPAVQRNTKV